MMTATLLLAAAFAAAPQAPAAAKPAAAQPPAGAQTASIRGTYDLAKGWLLKAAEQVPEEHYAFKPTADVRSLAPSSRTSPTRSSASAAPRAARSRR